MPQSHHTQAARQGRAGAARVFLGSLSLVLILGGLGVVALHAPSRGNHPPIPTIDPRLILHARSVAITASLTQNVRLTGTLTPDLPGHNIVDIALQGAIDRVESSSLRLVAIMPGMVMAPLRAMLVNHHEHYRGTLQLKMFGTYHLTVEVRVTTGMATGAFTITLPLPSV